MNPRINAILERLDGIPLMPAMLALFVIGLVVLLTPRRYHLGLAIAFFIAWISLGRFTLLGPISALAKATFVVPLLALIIAAWMHPGPRRKMPSLLWIYILTPLWAVACLLGTSSLPIALSYLACFFLSAVAASLVLKTIVDKGSLAAVVNAYCLGLIVPLLIILVAAFEGGSRHSLFTTGRFAPFGASSNQFIPILLQIMILSVYQFHELKKIYMKIASLIVIGFIFVILLKTGSRQGVVLLAAFLLPYGLIMIQRPLYLLLFTVVVFGGTFGVMKRGEDSLYQIQRATNFSDDSSRIDIALDYITNVIPQRPMVGLLGTNELLHNLDPSVGQAPHNAYLEVLYWGGLSLGIPLFVIMCATLYAACQLVLRRKQLNISSVSIVIFSSAMVSVYLHGMFSNLIYASIDSWAFFHFLLSGLLLGMYSDLKRIQVLR